MIPSSGDDLRALVEKWRRAANREHERGNGQDHVRDSQSYSYGQEHAFDACADDLEALLTSRSGSPPQEGWRPIETAPKGNHAFLAWEPENRTIRMVMQHPDGGRFEVFPDARPWPFQPTHWREIPNPPTTPPQEGLKE